MPSGDPFIPFGSSTPMTVPTFRDATEPGVQADVERLLSAAPPKPEIAGPADDEVFLPGGVAIAGQVIRTARVRELHGGDEEDLARAAASNKPERLISTLLMAGTVSIGTQPVTEDLLNRMLVGDRDALILGIRKATFGKSIEFERYACANCSQSFTLSRSN